METKKLYVVIPNWNGAARIQACLDSLEAQTQAHEVVVVDNGSIDSSIEIIKKNYPDVHIIRHSKNKGFTGGVNPGIEYAMQHAAEYVALLNNDAVADKNWLKNLVRFLDDQPKAAVATSKICDSEKTHLDSTGDIYTIWGLPYPRGRGEEYGTQYDNDKWVFGASGGASLYRIKALEQVGLFDNNFFAYYEDVDLSFRLQLAGWQIGYVPAAEVYHEISATSRQIKGFATYHTMKNLPMLFWKNVPGPLMPKIFPRFGLLYFSITASALARGQIIPVIKGVTMSILLWPKILIQRYEIQHQRRVNVSYIDSMISQDLPPNAHKLRRLRAGWWKIVRRKAT